MSVWVWVLVGAACWLTVSILVGLAVGAILNRAETSFSELLEHEPWTSSPLLRNDESAGEVSPAEDSPETSSAENVADHAI